MNVKLIAKIIEAEAEFCCRWWWSFISFNVQGKINGMGFDGKFLLFEFQMFPTLLSVFVIDCNIRYCSVL